MEPIVDDTPARAAESWIGFAVAGAISALIAGTLWYVHGLFAMIAPLDRLWLWTGSIIAVIAVLAGLPIFLHLRRPNDQEIVRIRSTIGTLIAVAFDLAVASSVWLLLPYASEPLRLLMVVFYAAAISGQVATTTGSLGTVTFGVVSIFGSATAFFLITPGSYSIGLAIFLLAYGALMIGVAAVLQVAARLAIAAQLRAEAVSEGLAAALDEATAARNRKIRFITAATHDLRQPLQAAAIFFDRLAAQRQTSDDGAMASAKLAFEEAAALLDRLLDHLKLDEDLIQPATRALPLGELLLRVQTEMAPLAAASGMEIRVVPTRVWVHADPHLLQRIVRNLAHNALRHSRGRRILFGARVREGLVRAWVIDDGRGVPDAASATLFAEERERGTGYTSGIGIGLTSSRRLAELMGGSVGHAPAWRRGAAFFLDLSSPDALAHPVHPNGRCALQWISPSPPEG